MVKSGNQTVGRWREKVVGSVGGFLGDIVKLMRGGQRWRAADSGGACHAHSAEISTMSYGGGAYPGSNAIEIIPDTSADPWPPTNTEQAIWATDDDYSAWSAADPAPAGSSEPPPNKKPRGGDAKAIGKMFFKTKLCCKFRAGTCPYITNCNFAHGMEELRRPPPNWQEIVAAAASHEDGPREEHQIPILSSETLMGDPDQRSYKGRHCKKFYTGEGCPYGDSCTYLHDEQSKARESVAISLTSSIGPVVGGYGGGAAGQNQKPSNWKTRICNKWELTGYCPFGSKCHFAHGVAELHRYGGGLMETEGRDASSAVPDSRHAGATARMPLDNVVTSNTTGPHADVYHLGVPAQRSVGVSQRVGQRPLQKWKGPDKISRIYGDWIDEND